MKKKVRDYLARHYRAYILLSPDDANTLAHEFYDELSTVFPTAYELRLLDAARQAVKSIRA